MITQQEKEKLGVFDTIEEMFDFISSPSSVSNQKGKNSIQWIGHYMNVLKELSENCDTIIELGINEVNSTWAFMMNRPKKITCVDLQLKTRHRNHLYHTTPHLCNPWLDKAIELAKQENIELVIIEGDSRKVDLEPADMMFIDTEHSYECLKQELTLHGPKIKKYIAIHDTELYHEELVAIEEFIAENTDWSIKMKYTSRPGLTILVNKKSSYKSCSINCFVF